jgi:lipopolysaccharide export system protein LptA
VQIRRLDAAGGVVVRSPSETARGAFAVYDLDRKLITMVGGVELLRGGSTINGQRLVIDLASGRAVVDGGPAGVGQSGGRVTGHFTVPQRGGR